MGVPNYLVASATRLIMAQRMVRKVCATCREEHHLTDEQIAALNVPEFLSKDLKAFKGRGCNECGNTGQSGRTGIYEVMPVTPAIEQMILSSATDTEIRSRL